jgi:type VI protein secretion system component Hcp
MATGESSDLLMKFVFEGREIPGEAMTQLDISGHVRNRLLSGFRQRYMFEVESFTFGAGLEGDESGEEGTHNAQNNKPNTAARGFKHPGKPPLTQGGKPGAASRSHSIHDFARFRSAGRSSKVKYPVDMHPVSFTRVVDRASPRLLQHCINRDLLDSASLIKRRGAGGPAAGEVFLRFDFKQVLIIQVDWTDDDEIKEACQFVCRSVTMHYRPQLPDGTLGKVVPGFWSVLPWDKPMTL